MKNGTWVVVADGRKVLYLHNHGDNDFIDLRVLDHREQVNPPTRDQGTDQPGRAYDGTGPGRSAMEAADWHQIAEDRFARQVAADQHLLEQAPDLRQRREGFLNELRAILADMDRIHELSSEQFYARELRLRERAG